MINIRNAAEENYKNAQSIEWNGRELKVDGVIVDHSGLIDRQKELNARHDKARIELKWIDSELIKTSQAIEDKEDQLQSAKALRAYRFKLKQYKTDVYMPNIKRPRL